MSLDLPRIAAIGLLAIGLSACSTSTGTINTPIGLIQLGMYIDEVTEVLGEGSVVEAERGEGSFLVQTRSYPADDGRTYVVYYVNDVVRRWELVDRPSTASQ